MNIHAYAILDGYRSMHSVNFAGLQYWDLRLGIRYKGIDFLNFKTYNPRKTSTATSPRQRGPP